MLVKQPKFYKNFHCTASGCTDSCCIGWEIDIDENTMRRYEAAGGAFGERLRENIEAGECPHFKLKAGDRCPFLNERNLCDIYLQLGEDALSEICTEHPRFHAWFGDYKESGLGLCCEEAVRLLLGSEWSLCETETAEAPDAEAFDEALLKQTLSFRERIFVLLQNKEMPIFERLHRMLALCGDVQDCLDFGATDEIANAESCAAGRFPLKFADALLAAGKTEPIDENWTRVFSALSENREAIEARLFSPSDRESEVYEKVAMHLAYRYFLKGAVFEGEILGYAVFVCAFILLLRGTQLVFPEQTVNNIKLLSKQFEYSEENLAVLAGL